MVGHLLDHWVIAGVMREILKESNIILFSYFLGAEKVFNERHSLSLATWGNTDRERTANGGNRRSLLFSEQSLYNPNLGISEWKKNEMHVLYVSFEPSAIASWNFTIDDNKKLVTSADSNIPTMGKVL